MNSLELTAGITALANSLARNLSLNELALVSALLVQLGDTMGTIAAERALCNEAEKE